MRAPGPPPEAVVARRGVDDGLRRRGPRGTRVDARARGAEAILERVPALADVSVGAKL